jgi:hypothetical protein
MPVSRAAFSPALLTQRDQGPDPVGLPARCRAADRERRRGQDRCHRDGHRHAGDGSYSATVPVTAGSWVVTVATATSSATGYAQATVTAG